MLLEDVYTKPGHLIRRAQQIAVACFMDECADFDITPVQYGALVAIRELPGLDATRLSRLIAFDRSTIGNVIDTIERKGWAQRRPDANDRRLKLLYLTPAGKRVLAEVEPAVLKAQDRILDPLTPAQRKQFTQLLAKLVALNNDLSRSPLQIDARPEA
jgi:MarR family transcriptional regulator, lower aerobic nicotinate degradation pathway regulator